MILGRMASEPSSYNANASTSTTANSAAAHEACCEYILRLFYFSVCHFGTNLNNV